MAENRPRQHKQALFIFHRDLRVTDNTGLAAALRESETVTPIFIFDPRQCAPHPYRSMNALQFMIDSLRELDTALAANGGALHLFHGDPARIIERALQSEGIDAVYMNRDYTPFAKGRDSEIAAVCERHHVPFIIHNDVLLHEPEEVRKGDGTPYTVFTPFWRNASALPTRSIDSTMPRKGAINGTALRGEASDKEALYNSLLPRKNDALFAHGGRRAGLAILGHLGRHKAYATERDIPAIAGTSGLSAHLKFGTVSIREAYYAIERALGIAHPLLRQLFWRDFFTHIAHHHPRVFGHAYHAKYDKVRWAVDPKALAAWKEGKTGFPIVDAGMRELLVTGYMHNRVRMIVSSFLVKDLHIDWREGERFFAQHLVDYDPCVNNGNWQWAASTGCDAQPYFRIFNPWTQQERFDPECVYIKKWVPELRDLPARAIHRLAAQPPLGIAYPAPIVDHAVESTKAKAMFAGVR